MNSYRFDIDGLRAIAILLVLFSHVGVPGVEGGFIGVDVFFVISGFLITSILLKEKEVSGTISLAGFYARRARRLLPALVVVLLATLLIGYWVLTPIGPQQELAKSAAAATFFVANLYFAQTTGGYFDGPSEELPLLHLWSLGVEEQFYLVWPILVLCLMSWVGRNPSRFRSPVFALAGLLTCVSFAYCLWLGAEEPVKAYYYPTSRGWQLLGGAALAVSLYGRTPTHRPYLGVVLATIGIVMVLGGGFAIEGESYPDLTALIPTTGTLALICAGYWAPANWISKALSSKPARFLGQISYPWYLWHWPLLAFLEFYSLGEAGLAAKAMLGIISLGLAYVTHVAIEKPFHRYSCGQRKAQFAWLRGGGLATLMVAVLALHLGLTAERNAQSSYYSHLAFANEDVPELRDECHQRAPFDELTESGICTVGAARSPFLFLWGDSHADHFSPLLRAFVEQNNGAFRHRTLSSCPPLLGYESMAAAQEPYCRRFNQLVLDEIRDLSKQGLKGVVLSTRWSGRTRRGKAHIRAAKEALARTVDTLASLGLRVVVVEPLPEMDHRAVPCLARRSSGACGIEAQMYDERLEKTQRIFTEAKELANVRILSLGKSICNEGVCSPVEGDTVLYRDDHHITATAAESFLNRAWDELAWASTHKEGEVIRSSQRAKAQRNLSKLREVEPDSWPGD